MWKSNKEAHVITLQCSKVRRRKWQPTPVLLPGKFHGQRSMVGYSPWDGKESGRTEQPSMHVVKSISGGRTRSSGISKVDLG